MDDGRLLTAPARYRQLVPGERSYAQEARRVLSLLPSGARVAEFRCRSGQLGEALLDEGVDWYGWEREPDRVDAGRPSLGERIHAGGLEDLPRDSEVLLGWFCPLSGVRPDELTETAASISAALRSGGTAIVEAWIQPADARQGWALMDSYSGEDVKLVRACVPVIDGQQARFDYSWLACSRGGTLRTELQTVTCWLHEDDAVQAAFAAAGVEAEVVEAEGLRVWRLAKG